MHLLQTFKDLKNEIVCKKRGHHEPIDEDISDFIKNSKFAKETYCKDCGCALELKLDEEESESYWIKEV